jgi:hypothetical protein
MAPAPPRLHVLMRPGSRRAVVLRRGGSKVYCAIGWDLADDRFVVGQWCKHKIYPQRCDISPDGRWMVYFALNGRWRSETKGAWSAVSRVPYLKALLLAAEGDTWGGGGLFVRARGQTSSPLGRLFASLAGDRDVRLIGGGNYQARLRRDGWEPGRDGLSKAVGRHWLLQKIGNGERSERHRLRGRSGAVIDLPHWEWAEYDAPRRRLVWAAHGAISCAVVDREGLLGERLLFDARPMTFEAIKAPYDSPTRFVR